MLSGVLLIILMRKCRCHWGGCLGLPSHPIALSPSSPLMSQGGAETAPGPDGEAGEPGSSGRAMSAEEAQAHLEHMQRMAAMEEAAVPLMLDAMWAANVVDIENTLKQVCRNVLQDAAVERDVRRARAAALRELGRIFTAAQPKNNEVCGVRSCGAPNCHFFQGGGKGKGKEARQHIEEALRKMQAKREEEEAGQGARDG